MLREDKRAQFFMLAAVVCVLLIPLASSQFRGLTAIVALVYALLALASALDHNGRG